MATGTISSTTSRAQFIDSKDYAGSPSHLMITKSNAESITLYNGETGVALIHLTAATTHVVFDGFLLSNYDLWIASSGNIDVTYNIW